MSQDPQDHIIADPPLVIQLPEPIEIPEELECLDSHHCDCAGAVEYRMPLTETGKSYARCDHHWSLRLDEQERLREYQSDSPPAWFDESYAGEHWDEDY